MSKPGKSTAIKPSRQLAIVSAKTIYSEIELFAAKQQGSADVLLDEI